MPENNSSLQKQWLSLVAIVTASLAFVGFNSPSTTTSDEQRREQKEGTRNLLSFPARNWEDPFAQAKEAKSSQKTTGNTSSLQQGDLVSLLDTLLELVRGESIEKIQMGKVDTLPTLDKLLELLRGESMEKIQQKSSNTPSTPEKTRLLVTLSIVKASDLPDSVENRIRIRHATELVLSNYQFYPLLSDRISYVSMKGLTSHLTDTRSQKVDLQVPVKLYHNTTTGQFVLNLWLDQDSLGVKPWRFIASLLDQIKSPHLKQLLRPLSAVAIVGPLDSDVLQKMEPDERTDDEFALRAGEKYAIDSVAPFDGWSSIHWISASSTVPRGILWGEGEPYKPKEKNRVRIDFLPIIDLDGRLISVLTYELKSRLGSSVATRQLLLFVEQDQKYGRNLGSMLRDEFESFDTKIIPYLRGLSDTKASPDSFSTGAAVSDYFQRTLARTTESWSYADAESFKPAAIGILGGTWSDKMLLLQVVRKRFPQSLVFTNDCDVRYIDPQHLPVTRNLIIASHQDPMPRVERSDTELSSIAFRDEYQATHFIGVSTLISKVFPLAYQSGPKLLKQEKYGSCVFEVATAGLLKMPSKAEETNPFSPVVGAIGAGLAILGLFLFPFAFQIPRLFVWSFASLSEEGKVRTEEPSPQEKAWVKWLWYWSPIFACLLVIVFSVAFVPKLESSGIRFSNLFSGVSVVPSILLLAISIPGTFRKTFRPAGRLVSRPAERLDSRNEQTNRIQEKVQEWQRMTNEVQFSLGPFGELAKKIDQSFTPILRQVAVATLSLIIGIAGFFTWYWTDDVWLLQIGLLGLLTCCLPSSRAMQAATMVTILIGLGIGILRFYAHDYSLVPARDSLLRAVGSCCFVVAYWWLLVGLLKLIVYYWRLRHSLRNAGRVLDVYRETKVINRHDAGEIYTILTETGELSQRISADLGTLTLIGLLVCVARLPIFDAWGMSFATWLTIVLPMALPFVFAIVFRRRAKRFRESAARFLERSIKKVEMNAADSDMDPKAIEDLLSRFNTYDKGAFAPLDRDPIISAGFAILFALFSGPNNDIPRKLISLFMH